MPGVYEVEVRHSHKPPRVAKVHVKRMRLFAAPSHEVVQEQLIVVSTRRFESCWCRQCDAWYGAFTGSDSEERGQAYVGGYDGKRTLRGDQGWQQPCYTSC